VLTHELESPVYLAPSIGHQAKFMRPSFLEALDGRVVIFDGAMGTSVQALELPAADYRGCENCPEVILLTRPEKIRQIHASFLEVGCDAIETNTFGANKIVLGEFGLAERTREINRIAATIARQVADAYSRDGHPRYVGGSMGPGTKLATLRQTSWDELADSYAEQVRGLIEGGVDLLVIETCQDILQGKAALAGADAAMSEAGVKLPVIVQVTMETTGTMLMGTDMAAAVAALEAYPQIEVIGLNCATGPREMSEHVRYLAGHCARKLSVMPNAGLPQLVGGRPHYALTPEELARWLVEFVEVDGVNIVGGCCGTTPAHLAAVVKAVGRRAPKDRRPETQPMVSSLYHGCPLRQENSFLIVGERCNTNGSRAFKRLLSEGDLDGCVQMAVEQVKQEGAHVLDVCVDYVGRDGVADMRRVVDRFAREVTAPLMLDSTQPEVIEAGLKLAGGKCIINSVNLEEGEERVARIAGLCRRYGAAVVALTIDEDKVEAMAKTAERKLAIATRLHELLVRRHGLREEDIFFDCLTFPITTGSEADRRLALETLKGIELVSRRFPRCQLILGVSNVSFGLQPATRAVLNSVFLHETCGRGLTAAIVHAGKIRPLFKIAEEQREAARRLVFDERDGGRDPLTEFIGLFREATETQTQEPQLPLTVEERLKKRIIDGNRTGLEADLQEAMKVHSPLSIINEILLDGMRVVGDLFGSGAMQLPFVLQSAETMKAAVGFLEPHLERAETGGKGKIVLATVKGDVHDIGKNLVDIILSNNGYTVYNLGIRQPIGQIVEAFRQHQADAIGLSGLLVKSTQVMRDDLMVLGEMGLAPPVILGGAALTRKYVEEDLRPLYGGPLFYAKDAFDGLSLMERIVAGQAAPPPAAEKRVVVAEPPEAPVPARIPRRSAVSTSVPVPVPPFWGRRVVEHVPVKALLPYLNEVMLFQVQWEYKKARRGAEEFRKYIDEQVRPILRELVAVCEAQHILRPQAIYGYFPAQSEGDDLMVYEPSDRRRELARFRFPRQQKAPYWCLSDFFRPTESGEMDVAAFAVVTMGGRVSEVAREWFAANRYRDYLHLHGLGVELTEALAEYLHRQVRMELGIADKDARETRKLFQQGYQGSRYSFGYPACPRLEDQELMWPLLEPGQIGVSLSEEYQLHPEQSTTALICHHPEARYFKA